MLSSLESSSLEDLWVFCGFKANAAGPLRDSRGCKEKKPDSGAVERLRIARVWMQESAEAIRNLILYIRLCLKFY